MNHAVTPIMLIVPMAITPLMELNCTFPKRKVFGIAVAAANTATAIRFWVNARSNGLRFCCIRRSNTVSMVIAANISGMTMMSVATNRMPYDADSSPVMF